VDNSLFIVSLTQCLLIGMKCALLLGASFLGHKSTLLCALGFVVCGGSSLDSIAKDCWVFPLIEKDFPRITSSVLVHGYSSCDIGYCSYCILYCCIVYGSSSC
jgi:hypothetical protein